MPQMDEAKLKAILGAQKADALAGMLSSKLASDRANAMAYYLGDMSADLPTVAGRSKAVSTDVADTVEGLMPALMEIFCGSDEVVKFNAVGPEDVQAAQQETDYVNHVFMQQNDGFLTLYSGIKDALLQKNCFWKVWWETRTEEERETYYDLDDDQMAMLAQDEDVEIVEHTVKIAGEEADEDPREDEAAEEQYAAI